MFSTTYNVSNGPIKYLKEMSWEHNKSCQNVAKKERNDIAMCHYSRGATVFRLDSKTFVGFIYILDTVCVSL